jgi:hypothetical protein
MLDTTVLWGIEEHVNDATLETTVTPVPVRRPKFKILSRPKFYFWLGFLAFSRGVDETQLRRRSCRRGPTIR